MTKLKSSFKISSENVDIDFEKFICKLEMRQEFVCGMQVHGICSLCLKKGAK